MRYVNKCLQMSAFACAFSSFIAQNALAQKNNEELENQETASKDTEHVLVSIPMHRLEAETALPVTVLTGDELRNRIANSIGETLNGKPGLTSASFGPSVGQPVIRGQQGARVTVLQNSTSSADASNISADHSVSVEPILADSIEVLRGPSTLLYGGGAIGGVVNVVDKRVPVDVPDKLSGAAEIRSGSVNDEKTGVLTLDGGKNSFAFHIDAMIRETENVEIPGLAILEEESEEDPDHQEENTSGFIGNTDSETSSVTFGASYIGNKGFIGFSVNKLDNEYGIPPGAHEHEDEDGAEEEEEEEIVRLDIKQTRYDVRGDVHDPVSFVENLRWFLTYTDYEHVELEGEEIGTEWSNESWENRIELLHNPVAGWHGVIGLQIKNSDIAAVGEESFIPKTEVNNVGFFIVEDYHTGDWIYEIGARLDIDSLKPEFLPTSTSDEESFNSMSFSASALWQINSPWSLGAALSQSERAPVIEELYSNDGNSIGDYVEHVATGAIEVGDSNLGSEQANNIDITLSYKTERIDGYLTVFYNNFRDYIFLSNTNTEQDETPILEYAQEDAKFKGLELEIEFILHTTPTGELSFEVFGDTISGRLDSAGDIPRLPPSRIGSRIDYEYKKLSTYISVINASAQNNPGFNEAQTDGYTRWDAGVNYHFSSGVDWLAFIRLKNITDEEIRNSTSFLRNIAPEPGRSLEAGIRLSF